MGVNACGVVYCQRGLAAVRKDMYRAQDEELTARSHLHRVEGTLKGDLSDAQARLAELTTEVWGGARRTGDCWGWGRASIRRIEHLRGAAGIEVYWC